MSIYGDEDHWADFISNLPANCDEHGNGWSTYFMTLVENHYIYSELDIFDKERFLKYVECFKDHPQFARAYLLQQTH